MRLRRTARTQDPQRKGEEKREPNQDQDDPGSSALCHQDRPGDLMHQRNVLSGSYTSRTNSSQEQNRGRPKAVTLSTSLCFQQMNGAPGRN